MFGSSTWSRSSCTVVGVKVVVAVALAPSGWPCTKHATAAVWVEIVQEVLNQSHWSWQQEYSYNNTTCSRERDSSLCCSKRSCLITNTRLLIETTLVVDKAPKKGWTGMPSWHCVHARWFLFGRGLFCFSPIGIFSSRYRRWLQGAVFITITDIYWFQLFLCGCINLTINRLID